MFQELILQIDENFHLSLSLFNQIRNIKVFMFAAVAALLLAVVIVTPVSAELPKGWNNLFQPPFQDTPTVMMAISCLSKDKCYISGGFDVFTFDGRQNGKFGFLNTPHMSMMMMAIGVGGTVEDPKGVSGGIGLGNGIQYFVNATTLMPSVVQPIFVITQDLRVSKDGTKVLIADAASLTVNQVLWSDDAGKTLRPINISTMVPAAGALPRLLLDCERHDVVCDAGPMAHRWEQQQHRWRRNYDREGAPPVSASKSCEGRRWTMDSKNDVRRNKRYPGADRLQLHHRQDD